MSKTKKTAEERVAGVRLYAEWNTFPNGTGLVVHEADAIRIAKEHADAAVAKITKERDDAWRQVEDYQHLLDRLCVVLGPLTHPWEVEHFVTRLKTEYRAVASWLKQAESARDEARAEVERLRELLRNVVPWPPSYDESPRYQISDKEWHKRMSRGSHFAAYVCDDGGSCWFESRDAALKAADVVEVKS